MGQEFLARALLPLLQVSGPPLSWRMFRDCTTHNVFLHPRSSKREVVSSLDASSSSFFLLQSPEEKVITCWSHYANHLIWIAGTLTLGCFDECTEYQAAPENFAHSYRVDEEETPTALHGVCFFPRTPCIWGQMRRRINCYIFLFWPHTRRRRWTASCTYRSERKKTEQNYFSVGVIILQSSACSPQSQQR